MLLRWTTSAARDLSEICDYIEAQDGAESARLLAERILEELEALLRFPQSGRPGRELRTRELVFRRLPYIAVYGFEAKRSRSPVSSTVRGSFLQELRSNNSSMLRSKVASLGSPQHLVPLLLYFSRLPV